MTIQSFIGSSLAFSVALGLSSPLFADDAATQSENTEETTVVTFGNIDKLASKTCKGLREAQPCQIEMAADSSNCRVRFRDIRIQTTVTYTNWGRKDSHQVNHHWTGDACRPRYYFPISNDVRGGNINLRITYAMTNGQNGTETKSLAITGENPTKDQIRAEINNLTYAVVFHHLSNLEQFKNGHPKLTRGFGVGALSAPNASDIWNWKRGVTLRKAGLDIAFSNAKNHPANMRNSGFANLPDFTEEQVKLQALQYIVGQDYFIPNASGNGWVEAKPRRPFADKIVQIEKDIQAGNPPNGW